MNQTEINNMAKREIAECSKLGIIELPITKSVIEKENQGITLKVYGLRTWSKRYSKSYEYLIAIGNEGRWNEDFRKIQL